MFADGFAVHFHGFYEFVEFGGLGVLAVGAGVDLGGLCVGFAADGLDGFVGFGGDAVEFAFFIADDTCGFAFAFGAEFGGDLLAFRDHAGVDFIGDGGVVVDAFYADVEEFDAELFEVFFGIFHDFVFEDGAAFADFGEDADVAGLAIGEFFEGFVFEGGAFFVGADDFDEVVFTDDAAGGGADDVFDAGVCGAFVAEAAEVFEGV